ncbi:Clp protease N-terminal domain-containing protein [Dactylosporangium sp. CA-152071]|uniref:Clp protease N-terminal domain-containing protein n=1 Tax=Dactylosporangium sp. CA-152071 TaxID=3239933 RepID=UPI003D8F5B26
MSEFGSDVVQSLIAAGRPWPMSGGPVDAGALLWAAEGGTGESAATHQALRRLRKIPGWGGKPPESVDDPLVRDFDAADPVALLLREADHLAGAQRATRSERPPAQWRESAVSGLRAALDEAREAGVAHVGRVHVLAGVLRSPGAATHGLPADPADRAELAAVIRADPCWREPGRPNRPAVAMLEGHRELADRAGFAGWRDRRFRLEHRQRDRYGTGAASILLWEAMRQAARLGDGPVTSAHLLLGAAGMAAQLRAADLHLRPAVQPFNAALDVLTAHGVTLDRAVSAMPDARVADLAVVPHGRAQLVIWFPGPGWTAEAVDAVDRAVALARDAGHGETGSSHLTVAALDADGTAARLVRALGADPGAVRDDVTRTLP